MRIDSVLFTRSARPCTKCDWQVHAWVLMTNHFHLVLETPLGQLGSAL
jgi:REP element-mobilizing transposase RayT